MNVYGLIDRLQLAGDYDELRQIRKYITDALLNDEEPLEVEE